jgi:hypothetical protein
MAAPALQTAAGPEFGDGLYQPDDMVTIHAVSNLKEGLAAKIVGCALPLQPRAFAAGTEPASSSRARGMRA